MSTSCLSWIHPDMAQTCVVPWLHSCIWSPKMSWLHTCNLEAGVCACSSAKSDVRQNEKLKGERGGKTMTKPRLWCNSSVAGTICSAVTLQPPPHPHPDWITILSRDLWKEESMVRTACSIVWTDALSVSLGCNCHDKLPSPLYSLKVSCLCFVLFSKMDTHEICCVEEWNVEI